MNKFDRFKFYRISNYPVIARLGIFLSILFLFWLPCAIPLQYFLRRDTNTATIATMGLLFVDFIILQFFWGRQVYRQKNIFSAYGLTGNTNNAIDLLRGLAIGICFCFALFVLEAICGWATIANPDGRILPVVAAGLLSALGIAFAEELFFRGWLFFELRRDYRLNVVCYSTALIFAIAHFLKPIAEIIRTCMTFPALFILGLTLVRAKIKYDDRLGICIGIHCGLVWGYYILNVGKLLTYTDNVPNWITGIDGNPIAGILGISFLLILLTSMQPNKNQSQKR